VGACRARAGVGVLDHRWRVGEHSPARSGEPLHRRAGRAVIPGGRAGGAGPPARERHRQAHDRLRDRVLLRQLEQPPDNGAPGGRFHGQPAERGDPGADGPLLPHRPAADEVRAVRHRHDLRRRDRCRPRDSPGVRPPGRRLRPVRLGTRPVPQQKRRHDGSAGRPAPVDRPVRAVPDGGGAAMATGDPGRAARPGPAVGGRVRLCGRGPHGRLHVA
jgi:hypothetical protein